MEGRLKGRQQKSNADVGGKGMGLGIVFDGKIIQIRRVSMNYRWSMPYSILSTWHLRQEK